MRGEAEEAILTLLSRRAEGATICPSEAARRIGGEGWRERMGEVRAAAARLADAGRIEVTQRGAVVDVRTARGPIRLRDLPHQGATD